MEKHVERFISKNSESQLIGIIIAIFTVTITLVLYVLWRRRTSIGHCILLTGLCNAGKTLIYARLIHTKYVQTHTSVKENISDLEYNHSIKIVDIPGHERLRYKFFDKYKKFAKGLVFVIDSVTIQKDVRDTAEFLYTLLSDLMIRKSVPILILCNKQDHTLAKNSTVIKAVLEKEMNLLRVTKTNQLDNTDASSSNVYLGITGKDFSFSHLDRKIKFAECSAGTPTDLEQFKSWLINLD
ncbi:PREDICTED: signal recognition particle receptor subunit beta [Ceratosolen solmsi marchali]|uniref:Signal recognition particle receptor subunit beta n=1 Tax=Ceratosolen solmsi marchali TaxID=326594 RepID=A0AAJ7DUH9_9HYME|nr:PREDICTED: signal recognition particle receptor subunit beta [Ceratosolen solmsi marchali]